MRYYPLFVDTHNRRIALVGDGIEAINKYRLIKRTDAVLDLYCDNPIEELRTLAAQDAIAFTPTKKFNYLHPYLAVFIATDDDELETAIYNHCIKHNIAVNVVDKKERCTFLTPALIDRSPLVIAIGTEGAAPVLARHIKSDLERKLPRETGALLEFLASKRAWLAQRLRSNKERREFWQALMPLDNPLWLAKKPKMEWFKHVKQQVEALKRRQTSAALTEIVVNHAGEYTFSERRALQTADMVINTGSVDQFTNDFARRDALFIECTAEKATALANQSLRKGLNVVIIQNIATEQSVYQETHSPNYALLEEIA